MNGPARRGTPRIGCSGWSYEGWRGPVYAPHEPKRRWFELYAERFDTVELNTTFYRLPDASTVARWREQAPESFVYAVKVGQFASHRMKLRNAQSWLPRHLDRVERLGPALGPNLIQLPPRWRRDVNRLEELLTLVPTSMRWAVELRDPSWLHDDVFDALSRHRVALCLHDMLTGHPWLRTTDWAYLRFHGPSAPERPYNGTYTGRRLWRATDRLGAWLDEGFDVYAYFNNDGGGAAVLDATWMAEHLAGS